MINAPSRLLLTAANACHYYGMVLRELWINLSLHTKMVLPGLVRGLPSGPQEVGSVQFTASNTSWVRLESHRGNM
jgi:hypothetical protein